MKNWRGKAREWSEETITEYVAWVRETFGEEEANNIFKRADQFRAVKEVEASVAPQTNPYTDALAHSMLHTKNVIAANLLNKVFDEEYKEHGKALLNEYNQP